MNDDELARIANLASADHAPHARPLEPDVRSGVSFTFGAINPGGATWPNFQVVWFYTVKPADRTAFTAAVGAYETGGTLAANGVTYLGTYSVTISAAAPDLEYRTVWGLNSIGALQALNDALHGAVAPLRTWMNLISQDKPMRSEMMGRTFASAIVARS